MGSLAEAHVRTALARADEGKVDAALEAVRRLLASSSHALSPTPVQRALAMCGGEKGPVWLHFHLGLVLDRCGKHRDAAGCFERASEPGPHRRRGATVASLEGLWSISS